ETLPLRMRAHCANANAAARFLSEHPKVTRVIFPGQMTGEAKRRADAYMKGGYGGLVGFELRGGVEAGRRVIDSLEMVYHVGHLAPWQWNSDSGRLARAEKIGDRLGRIEIIQRHPGAVHVGWAGFGIAAKPEILRRVQRWMSVDWEPLAAIAALPDAAGLIER